MKTILEIAIEKIENGKVNELTLLEMQAIDNDNLSINDEQYAFDNNY
jgi:hypothetical protein